MARKHSVGRIILNIILGIILAGLVALYLFVHGTRQIPEAYKDTIRVSPDERRALSHRFAEKLFALGMKLRRDESFSEEIPLEQLNAWMQYDFETRDEFIPPRLGTPQIHIEDDHFVLMAKVSPPRWHTMVVSVHVLPVTRPDGRMGFEVLRVEGGRIRVPESLLSDELAQLRELDIDLGGITVEPAGDAVKVTFEAED